MKVRNGFVSNSSSSSFIVALDKKPETVGEILDIFFPSGRGVCCEYYTDAEGFPEEISAADAASMIQQKMQGPLDKERLLEEIRKSYFEGYPEYRYDKESDEFEREYHRQTGEDIRGKDTPQEVKDKFHTILEKEWKERDEEIDFCAEQYLDKVLRETQGGLLFCMEFADEDSIWEGIMEHGNAFRNVSHYKMSRH